MITINSIKKKILLAGGLFLAALTAKADNNPTGLTSEMLAPQFTEMTPEAASLGKYGSFNISEYSGSPNIRIPLHTITTGNISIPMELYYDASGIKVEQDATFVGLGWNLNYGGHISHIVCGQDDFRESPDCNYDYFNKLFKNKNQAEKYWENIPVQYAYTLDKVNLRWDNCLITKHDPLEDMRNRLPTEISKGRFIPDIFQASFCGHNISFVIDKREPMVNGKYQVIVLNENPNKYKISYQSGYPHPKSFLITDDKGINYEFTGYREFLWVDSYYLTKVYGPDGANGKNVITFDYTHKRFTAANSRPNTKSSLCDRKLITDNCLLSRVNSYIFSNILVKQTENIEITPSEGCDKYYPSKITTPTEIIEFTLDSSRKDLKGACSISDIVVKSKDGINTLKKIHLKYGYYEEDGAQSSYYTGLRLRLDGVNINDQNYAMEYTNGKLPSFGSYSKDYWGYYNGAKNSDLCASPRFLINNNKQVVPAESLGNANRLASAELCKVGMLKKITYPTGGYTIFEFEPNRFNDEFYYPDANDKLAFPPKVNTYSDGSISVLGTMTKTMTLKATQEKYDIKINAVLKGTSDKLFLTIKDSRTNAVVNSFFEIGSKNIGKTVSFTLTKGSTYIIEAELTAVQANSSYTMASFDVTHDVENPQIASPTTKNENGGYSIGGGLRIKSIKNYDAPKSGTTGEFLNGTLYEYAGGKLLIPTVRIAEHHINYTGMEMTSYNPNSGATYSNTQPIAVTFQNINAEPAYMDICSLGVPATVGYDTVTVKEIDKDGNVKRKKVSQYYNHAYEIDKGMNTCSGNAYFFSTQGYKNGKIENEYIYSGTDIIISSTKYLYDMDKLGSIIFPKSTPLFFGVDGVGVKDGSFDVTLYRHYNTWCYLTKKTETYYDSKGKQATSNITQYAYNKNNYQPMRVTVYDDKKQNSRCTCLYYPSDKGMAGGSDYLLQKNCLSEVVRTYVYNDIFNTNTFVGGSYNNYVLRNDLPVVSECHSITPAWKTNLEMKVTKHDDYGNIREYQKKNGTPVTIIWSYNHQLPIMEIVGCTYDEACKKATSLSSLESKASVAETTISSIHSTLMKGLPNAYVTAYTYSPWQSVSQIIKPNGEKTVYSYDSYGRLTTVLDANQSTFQPIQMYNYNYKNK